MNLRFIEIQTIIDSLEDKRLRLLKSKGEEYDENPIMKLQESTSKAGLGNIAGDDYKSKYEQDIEMLEELIGKINGELGKASFEFNLTQGKVTTLHENH